ncbi:hypothetical protein ACFZBU_09795 [Embleya sp. NPDC008237]|uniref:hypothetical protein n=1 Tax=Embleya sp. NPDC008237 TaxID=3363978 RepID=UPI0036F152EC
MTVLRLADSAAAADLGGYLTRLLRYDRRAVVRMRAEGSVLGTFGHPPFGEAASGVITLRASGLAVPATADVTVSAGQLLDAIADDASVTLPASVTGPGWAGMLPPRTGWERVAELGVLDLGREVAAGVAEFRSRTEPGMPRAEFDRIAADIWTRPLPGRLPLRAAHAAQSFGFLGPPDPEGRVEVLTAGAWLRLEARYGSVSVRRPDAPGLLFTR